MDQYKNTLKKRLYLLSICLIMYITTNYIMYSHVGTRRDGADTDFILGFQFGIGFFVFALLAYFIIRYISVLHSEKRLKEMYIADTDERKLMIYQKSGSAGMTFAIFGLAISAVLAGYYNTTVFFSLLGSCLFLAFIRAALKLYYKNKY